MRAHEFLYKHRLNEDVENFPIANVRRPNGAIGNQGVNIEQAADVLTHAAGMQVSPDMSMRQLVDALQADPAAQQRLRQFVQQNPITVYALPDGTYHLQDGHHRTFLLNLLGDETVPAVVKEGVTEAKTVEFEGLTLKVIKQGHELVVDALDDWGNKVLGHVKFNIGDGKELDPQDLRVDDRYQGQGIARVMYDYVKSLGYTIVRSPDQTDAGAGFWNKHRGEDVRVWEQGVAEARKNPEQNTKYQSGWAELAAWARKNNVWLKPHEWAISMTYVPKLGINPGPGISEDTPRGIYFYPFQWAYSVKMDKEALPWADNAPYIQLFQYSTGTELYDPNQIPLASAVAQLKNYGITDEDIAAEKENYPGISTYNLLVWCLGRKYDDNKRVTILNKVLRNLGYDYMIDNGKGWIAINEPTQGVVLNPKIIDKVVTFNNYTRKKEQGVAEAPLADYQPIGDFDKPGPFRGADKKLIPHPVNQLKAQRFFEKTPYNFRLFFSNIPGTGKYSEYGIMDPDTVKIIFGDAGEQIVAGHENAITVVYVGNSGDSKVMLTPWMMAHRLGHAIQVGARGQMRNQQQPWKAGEDHFFGQVNSMLEEYYGKSGQPGGNLKAELTPEYNALFNAMGTQRSSRSGEIRRPYEFLYEIFAQYLGTGTVTFNALPANLGYGRRVWGNPSRYLNIKPEYRDETVRKQAAEVLSYDMELMFNDALSNVEGKILVM